MLNFMYLKPFLFMPNMKHGFDSNNLFGIKSHVEFFFYEIENRYIIINK